MIPSFTGYENIYLGAESERGRLFSRIRRRHLRRKAAAGAEPSPGRSGSRLRHVECPQCETGTFDA